MYTPALSPSTLGRSVVEAPSTTSAQALLLNPGQTIAHGFTATRADGIEIGSLGGQLTPPFGGLTFDLITAYLLERAHAKYSIPAAAPRYYPGTTVYVDPSAASNGSGTFASPFKTWPATLTAGTAYLIKEGTTVVGTITTGVVGTQSAPVVIGVYDAVTGYRILGFPGVATVDANAGAFGVYLTAGAAYVEVEGLSVVNTSGTGSYGVYAADTSYCRVRCCQMTNLPGTAAAANGNSALSTYTLFEGNFIRGCLDGIVCGGNAGFESLKVNSNTVKGCTRHGIRVLGYLASSQCANSEVIGNVVTDCASNGIYHQICALNARVLLNTCLRNGPYGLKVGCGNSSGPDTTQGVIVAGNISCHNEMGIHVGMLKGEWVLEFNVTWRNGSVDGVNPVTASRYGRGIETATASYAVSNTGGTIRYNSACENYNFGGLAQNATEGVGIGTDDFTRDTLVYGNYIARNEGNGLQPYQNHNIVCSGNLLVDNMNLPVGDRGNLSVPDGVKAQIVVNDVVRCSVVNNTIVSTTDHRYRVAGVIFGTNANNRTHSAFGNVIQGHTQGIRLGGGAVEDYNAFYGVAAPTVNASSGAVAMGSNSAASAQPVLAAPFYLVNAAGRSLLASADTGPQTFFSLHGVFGGVLPSYVTRGAV